MKRSIYDQQKIVTLKDLNKGQWMEIQEIALKLHRSGRYSAYGRAWIYAFVSWLEFNNLAINYDTDEEKPRADDRH